jgi:hypothetical protein
VVPQTRVEASGGGRNLSSTWCGTGIYGAGMVL